MDTLQIRKVCQIFNEAKQTWSDNFEAPGIEGSPVTATVPRGECEPVVVRRRLLDKGTLLPELRECRAALVSAIAANAPIVHQADRMGWRDNNQRFVSFQHVASSSTAPKAIIPPASKFLGSTGHLEIKGDLKGFQELAAVASHSTAAALALCGVFAAPLLGLLRLGSFALVFYGSSRSGKTTAQLLAASALGFGLEEHLLNLNATPAGLLELYPVSDRLTPAGIFKPAVL